jgi:hypothetical protein
MGCVLVGAVVGCVYVRRRREVLRRRLRRERRRRRGKVGEVGFLFSFLETFRPSFLWGGGI